MSRVFATELAMFVHFKLLFHFFLVALSIVRNIPTL